MYPKDQCLTNSMVTVYDGQDESLRGMVNEHPPSFGESMGVFWDKSFTEMRDQLDKEWNERPKIHDPLHQSIKDLQRDY